MANVLSNEVYRKGLKYRKIGKAPSQDREARSPDSVFCNWGVNDDHRTFFSCVKWDGFFSNFMKNTKELSPDSIII